VDELEARRQRHSNVTVKTALPAGENVQWSPQTSYSSSYPAIICPDTLRLENLGEADAWRGKIVRVFFRALRVVTGV
jgi:hypothetical protein